MARLSDIVIACILLAVTLPLMIVVALTIKWDSSGPLFDRETSIATGGRRFQRLKFRTTVFSSARRWTQEPTRLSDFLRYTRIERLPELINVLCGDLRMSDTSLFD